MSERHTRENDKATHEKENERERDTCEGERMTDKHIKVKE